MGSTLVSRRGARRRVRWWSGLLVLGFLAGGVSATTPATPARAADPFAAGELYALQGAITNSTRSYFHIDPDAETSVEDGAVSGPANRQLNALGISADGATAFYVRQGGGGVEAVYVYDRVTEVPSVYAMTGGVRGGSHGGVDPASGIYYFGGLRDYANGEATIDVYGLNPATQEYLGLVATGRVPATGTSGDWAFDNRGRMYLTAGANPGASAISVLNQRLPRTAGSQVTVTATQFATVTTDQGIGGIAFGGDGYLYVSGTSRIFQVDPTTGTVGTSFSIGTGFTDLASSAAPHTVTVQKDFPDGRARRGDQVTVRVDGGGISRANTGTTTGDDAGIQDEADEQAGPIPVRPGERFTISESGTGADPDAYRSGWRCVDEISETEVANGSGRSGEFTMPRGANGAGVSVVCTFTNRVLRPAIEIEKVAELDDANGNGVADVGETIAYGFTVRNSGDGPLLDVRVDDPRLGDAIDPASYERLDAGESVRFRAPYTVTQADVDTGAVANTATALGTPPGREAVRSQPDSASIPVEQTPTLELEKNADKTQLVLGETVTYSFIVRNTGNVTLTDAGVAEGDFTGSGELSQIDCPAGIASIAPKDSVTCTATYEVTQADIDRGTIENSATAAATAPGDRRIEAPEASEQIPQEPEPELELLKTADTDSLVLGETITYSFKATNTGNVTLHDVTVDELGFSGEGALSAIDCPADETASLAPGASVTCTASYVVTQADVDDGSIENTARANGAPPNGPAVASEPSSVTITEPAAPDLSVEKSADRTALVVGETITYTFVVRNTGNVTMTDVSVDEGDFSGSGTLSAVDCPADEAASLAPEGSITCTATYEVTQADVDRGSVDNEASASGVPPAGGDRVDSAPDSVRIAAEQAPAIEIEKTADTDSLVRGETITYAFEVRNVGNVTLSELAIEEADFSGSGALSAIDCPADASSLAPGGSVTCRATYEVTQEDVDRGELENSATAVGTPPGDAAPPVRSAESTATITQDAEPGIELEKTSDADDLVAGETITYWFLVRNTGNVTLSDIEVDEGEFSGSGQLSAIDCPADEAASLSPGETMLCSATYEVVQADVDRGTIENDATASGASPAGVRSESEPSEATVPSDPAPSIAVVKSADTEELVVGETVTYSFLVRNTGNVTLTEVSVADGDFSGAGELSAIDCPAEASSLGPSQSVTCTATYEVTQADVDAGMLTNSATAAGTPPGGQVVESAPSRAEVEAEQTPSLSVVKSADTDELVAGATITYSFVVTNTGNVTLSEVGIVEGEFTGSGELSAVECPASSLAPDASVTCTATYEVTQSDVDAGALQNSATAEGTPPGAADPVTSEVSDVTITEDPAPSLTVVKSADTDELVAGATITYSFVVTNTGNVTLSEVGIVEGEFTGSGELSAIECPATSVAPDASVTCTATYKVTQADVDRGSVANTATAGGTPPAGGDPVRSEPSTVTVSQEPAPSLSVVKSTDTDELVAGATITYSFVVTNTGNVTLSQVTVVEGEFTGSGELSAIECPAAPASLSPGSQLRCTATYEVTQADVDAGSVANTATATAVTPGGDELGSAPSAVSVPQQPAPQLTLVKTVDRDSATAGDSITYAFTVTNTGNVTISGIEIDEATFTGSGPLSAVECPAEWPSALAPGKTVVCTAGYVVTAADAANGGISNVAVTRGQSPDGDALASEEARVELALTAPAPNDHAARVRAVRIRPRGHPLDSRRRDRRDLRRRDCPAPHAATEPPMTTGRKPRRTEPGGTAIPALGKEHHASTT